MTLPVSIETGLLPAEATQSLAELSEELNHVYHHRQIFRTETEARISVLNDIAFPTQESKYWQASREQAVMLEQLATLSFEYRRNRVAIKRLEQKLATLTDPFDREEAQIDLDECMYKDVSMRTVAKDRVRELEMWSKIKREFTKEFDRDNVDTHQLISYTTHFALRAATIDPSSMSEGEQMNLTGQLTTALNRCNQLGVLDKVLINLPQQYADNLRLQLNAPAQLLK